MLRQYPKIGIFIASSIMLGSRGIRSVGVTIKLVSTFIYPVGRVIYAVGTTINSPRNIMAAAAAATSPVIVALSTLPKRVAVVTETTPAAWDRSCGALGE